METCKCARCGGEWYQRRPERPLRCAKCKAPYWWRPARVRKERIIGPVGAPVKYPFHDLAPGASILIPWPATPDGKNRDFKRILSINSCISSHARRTGKKFYKEGQPVGMYVKRLS